MTITFHLPADLEDALRRDAADLNLEAREAFLVDLYRRGRLTHAALASALGVDRIDVEHTLAKHNVVEDLGTPADYLSDAESIRHVLSEKPR